ncbi:MAG: hypothetical protein QXI37_03070, partial [Thermoprotei archaeon]
MAKIVKVYVRSEKIPVGISEVASRNPTGLSGLGNVGESAPVIQYDYQTPDEQKNALLLVREVCSERGYEVDVVDITKEGLIKKILGSDADSSSGLPVVVTPDGIRLRGHEITRSSLERSLPADMAGKEIRGFVYIKCKKGVESKLVDELMTLAEVKEVHLIP